MAQKIVIPPPFVVSRPQPPGKPDGHQTQTSTIRMDTWVKLDMEWKESQPSLQYS